jgi:hypothetical protein
MGKGKEPEIRKTEKEMLYPGFGEAMSNLSGMAADATGRLGEAYGGQMVAGLDPMQQQAYDRFNQWMGAGGSSQFMQDPLYQRSRQLMGDVLGGKYLENNPYVDWARDKSMSEDLPEMQAALRRALALKGNFYSSAGTEGEQDILTDLGKNLQGMYAQAYGTELDRMLGYIPAGMEVSQMEGQLPLQDIDMQNQMGDFLRQLEQQRLSADYDEWSRQRNESVMMPLQMAPQGSQMAKQYDYEMIPGKPSAFEKWISPALQIGSLAAMPFTGGMSALAIPALQGAQQAFGTQGVNPGGFSNFVNAFSPMASMGMGAFNPAWNPSNTFQKWLQMPGTSHSGGINIGQGRTTYGPGNVPTGFK